ncbi:hypothetical protein LUZ60_015265 [Juncus effusus]|nr:hypothetical protein LUZ60_015265 [Juncus effusus]
MDHQASYLMWSRRRWNINTRPQPSLFSSLNYTSNHDSTWEEQAFAEDTLHIWPPRSYSCSFCKREFRSAQALGGHMNVHRRDRARLRQQPSSPTLEDQEQTNFVQLDQDGSNPICNYSSYNYHSSDAKEVFMPGPDLDIGGGNLKRKNYSFDDYEEANSRKRRCVEPEFHLFVRNNSQVQVHKLQSEVTKISSSVPIEELDLELRLGNCQQVN